MISPQHPYSLYDKRGVPLDLSTRSSLALHRQLFYMESEGEIPVSTLSQSKVSATRTPHIDDE